MAGPFLWEVLAAACVEELPSLQLKQLLCSVDIFPHINLVWSTHKTSEYQIDNLMLIVQQLH